MSIGMDYRTFWYDEPDILDMYIKTYELVEERKLNELNLIAWLNGSYVYEAVAVVVSNALSENSSLTYADQPRPLKDEEDNTSVDSEVLLFQSQFDTWSKLMNKQFEGDGQ